MSDLRAFFGPNAGYVLELYDRFVADPESIDAESRAFFEAFVPPTEGDSHPQPHVAAQVAASPIDLRKVAATVNFATAIREYGHLAVPLDPLGSEPPGAPELILESYGLTDDDLKTIPADIVGGEAADGAANAFEAIERLRRRYTSRIGFDFDHVQVAEERAWLNDAVESGRFEVEPDEGSQRKLLERLTQIEVFERFLHQTYLGQKRFSIEGNDIIVPMLDQITDDASSAGTREVFLGMAHRGRLNVMTHILNKPYGAIIAAFEGGKRRTAGRSESTDDVQTGDVKYHLGARLARNRETGERVKMPIILAPNPSHLEAVNPIVLGMARASQDDRSAAGPPRQDSSRSLSILLHGDASFPGQGVVSESLNLSGLRGYTVGGTVHIIVNNQIGYTTDWQDSRSTLYAGDLAKGFEIPVIHVNADDPLACLQAASMAMAYRREFGKDFLIDVVGYRRWGHNEGDEPAFTQPLLYRDIGKHPTVRAIWAERLVEKGIVTQDDVAAVEQRVLDRLSRIRRGITEGTDTYDEQESLAPGQREEVDTALPKDRLKALDAGVHALPGEFSPNGKLKRIWDRRAQIVQTGEGKIDWAHAEALAFAALLADGIPIRLTGQDVQRGTFSQRHIVLHDAKTGEAYSPLARLPEAKASFAIYNSPLSENAAVGFEYGYSVQAPEALVLWEAQFGDFVNGAQIVIDQFLSAARSKWAQEPSLVLLLPHGYEGQGPEHSSARLERFLQLAADDNMRVANLTSASQYFHLLRRQAARLDRDPRPLVLMTPKSLLRNPMAASSPEQFMSGTFLPVIDDAKAQDRKDKVSRLVFCSGKVAIDLESSDQRDTAEHVAVVRVEQLAPFQSSILKDIIDSYPNVSEIVWLQEEPKNMGAWTFMVQRFRELIADAYSVRYIGRVERASPAEGSLEQHNEEQAAIVAAAFASEAASDATDSNGSVPAGRRKDTKRVAREREAVAASSAN
jgi:2-oxoglutarate dehydrogenase E1 component